MDLIADADCCCQLDHSPSWTQCAFPPNSISQCTPSNVCAFSCTQAGHIPLGSKCVCGRPGYRVCDGTCSYAPAGCKKRGDDEPTSAKLMQQRDLRPRASGDGKGRRAEPLSVRNFKPRPRCPAGLTACGVPLDDPRNRKTSWECFDTQDDSENCELSSFSLGTPRLLCAESVLVFSDACASTLPRWRLQDTVPRELTAIYGRALASRTRLLHHRGGEDDHVRRGRVSGGKMSAGVAGQRDETKVYAIGDLQRAGLQSSVDTARPCFLWTVEGPDRTMIL